MSAMASGMMTVTTKAAMTLTITTEKPVSPPYMAAHPVMAKTAT